MKNPFFKLKCLIIVFSCVLMILLNTVAAHCDIQEIMETQLRRYGLGSNEIGDLDWDGSHLWIAAKGAISKLLGEGSSSSDWLTLISEPGFGIGGISALFTEDDIVIVGWNRTEKIGENNVSVGDGLSISLDGGETFTHFGVLDIFPERKDAAYPEAWRTCYDVDISGGIIWAAFTSGYAKKTTDYGETWETVLPDDGPYEFQNPNHHGQCVLTYNDTIWVGTFQGINKSVDGGETWTNYYVRLDSTGEIQTGSILGNFVVSVERQVVAGKTIIWAGTSPFGGRGHNGVCYTMDNGETWTTVIKDSPPAWNFAFGHQSIVNSTVSDSTVWITSDAGILRSDDFGQSWTTIEIRQSDLVFWPTETRIIGIEVVGDTLWVGGINGLARSVDLGETWRIFQGMVRTPSLDMGEYVGIGSDSVTIKSYAFPSPFTPSRPTSNRNSTQVSYSLSESAEVTVRIYNFAGNLIKTLVKDVYRKGQENHTEKWYGRDGKGEIVANGVYFYIIETSTGHETYGKVMVLD